MNADDGDARLGHPISSREITGRILRAFFEVNRELGAGFLEVVYVRALCRALGDLGLSVKTEIPIPVRFRGSVIGCFRADLVVERTVLVEVKAVPQLEAAHTAQLLNYLRASDIELGLLLNCGRRQEFKRFVFGNDRKHRLRSSAYICGPIDQGERETAAALDAPCPPSPR